MGRRARKKVNNSATDDCSDFEIGDLVWAKMKHWPYWPGQIADPNDDEPNKSEHGYLCVTFFGTNNHAYLKPSNIKPYLPHRQEYSKASMKVQFFTAINEIKSYYLEHKDYYKNQNGGESHKLKRTKKSGSTDETIQIDEDRTSISLDSGVDSVEMHSEMCISPSASSVKSIEQSATNNIQKRQMEMTTAHTHTANKGFDQNHLMKKIKIITKEAEDAMRKNYSEKICKLYTQLQNALVERYHTNEGQTTSATMEQQSSNSIEQTTTPTCGGPLAAADSEFSSPSDQSSIFEIGSWLVPDTGRSPVQSMPPYKIKLEKVSNQDSMKNAGYELKLATVVLERL